MASGSGFGPSCGAGRGPINNEVSAREQIGGVGAVLMSPLSMLPDDRRHLAVLGSALLRGSLNLHERRDGYETVTKPYFDDTSWPLATLGDV